MTGIFTVTCSTDQMNPIIYSRFRRDNLCSESSSLATSYSSIILPVVSILLPYSRRPRLRCTVYFILTRQIIFSPPPLHGIVFVQ